MGTIRSEPARVVMAALLATAMAGALASCSPNAGTEAGQRFEQELRQVAGVVSVDASGDNTLPFTGMASADVELEPATTDARVGEIVDVVGAYLAEHSTARVRWTPVTLAVAGFELEVTDTRAANDKQVRVFTTVRHDPALAGARLVLAPTHDAGGSLELTAADGTTFLETLAAGRALAADVPFYAGATVVATSSDGLFTASTRREDDTAGDPAAAVAAYEAVAARFTVTAAELSPESATIRVDRDADTAAASTLAESAPGAGALSLAINGGTVTRAGVGDFGTIDGVLAATATVTGVLGVDASPTAIAYSVSDLAAAEAVVRAVGELPSAPDAVILTIRGPRAGAFEREFELTARPAGLGAALELVRAAEAFTPVTVAIDSRNPSARFTVRATDRDGLTALIRIVKPRLPAGTAVSLELTRAGGEDSRVQFESGDQVIIDPRTGSESRADAAARDLVSQAWNAVPAA